MIRKPYIIDRLCKDVQRAVKMVVYLWQCWRRSWTTYLIFHIRPRLAEWMQTVCQRFCFDFQWEEKIGPAAASWYSTYNQARTLTETRTEGSQSHDKAPCNLQHQPFNQTGIVCYSSQRDKIFPSYIVAISVLSDQSRNTQYVCNKATKHAVICSLWIVNI